MIAIVAQWHQQGAGLTYSRVTNWIVSPAFIPAHADIRKRRLLGLGSDVRFWIYQDVSGAFVARLYDGKIQAFGETASQAIVNLRTAFTNLRKLPRVILN